MVLWIKQKFGINKTYKNGTNNKRYNYNVWIKYFIYKINIYLEFLINLNFNFKHILFNHYV